jgi:hypothetical protein
LLSSVLTVFPTVKTSALSGSSFNAGNIIDDSVFYDENAMDSSQVQSFLNAKVPTCDTNGLKKYTGSSAAKDYNGDGIIQRWERGKYAGYPAPYTCLKNYKQNTPSIAAESGICGNFTAQTGRSAASIITDVATTCGINPQVLIVLLQKEQALVTDDWPWSYQYQKATGFACPDTAPCDTAYYGFFNQVYHAARQFKRYQADPHNWNYVAGQSNKIYYNPSTSCGYSWVTIQNQATAGLYDYTPYQPNKAALDNLYGTGNSCSAYGNRNFWRYFNDWFGNPTSAAVYSWSFVSKGLYSDSARTNPIADNTALTAGQTVYFRLVATNTGNRVWYPPMVKLGTTNPRDRISEVRNSSWPKANRAAYLKETSVSPGENGTFEGSFTLPSSYTGYKEYFSLVADGVTWFNDPGVYFILNMPNYSATAVSVEAYKDSGRTNKLSATNIATYTGLPLYMRVKIKNTGNQDLPGDLTKLATTNPKDRASVFSNTTWLGTDNNRAALLKDGTLHPGETGTFNFTMTAPESTGTFDEWFGVVIEDKRWVATDTADYKIQVNARPASVLTSGEQLSRGQSILSGDGRYEFTLQTDGNLVLYSPVRFTWSSWTAGKGGTTLVMQSDGNLVLYSATNRPIWHSHTAGNGPSRLIMQSDGNLVIYRYSDNRPTWNTHTHGKL